MMADMRFTISVKDVDVYRDVLEYLAFFQCHVEALNPLFAEAVNGQFTKIFNKPVPSIPE